MTNIIIDTNIIFSAFLNINSKIGQILINGSKYYKFIAPEYLKDEIREHQSKIKTLRKLNNDNFLELYELIIRNLIVINHSLVSPEFYKEAYNICEKIDPDDTIFVAYSNYFRANLWTGDKKLIKGLEKVAFKRIITTEELYKDFIIKDYKK